MHCPHQVPICAAHMFPLLLQLWNALYSGIKITQKLATHVLSPLKFCRCAPEEGVSAQNQLDGREDIEGVVHHLDLQSVPMPVHELQLGRDCLCLPIRKTRVKIWAGLPMSTD